MQALGIDFWAIHGFWFVVFMCLFPRLTMLFTSICFMPFAGPLFWVGWVLAPRLTVAIIATFLYFQTNPVLCVFTWIWAMSGESTEKSYVAKGYHRI